MEQWQKWTDDDARLFIKVPTELDDKYSRGVLGVIAGSNQYPGAAVMVCEGALRTGVGMVRYLGPAKAESLLLTHRPEVVIQDGQVQAWTKSAGNANSQ
jgi:NAD(P)H-hydrate repair Nnr-like enzyme with NAD(P)H-hydrate dehydratase domain